MPASHPQPRGVPKAPARAARRRRGRAVALAALLLAPLARAAPPVLVLTQNGVPQYNEVLQGLREVQPGATSLDIADEVGVAAQLADKPLVVVAVGSKAFGVAKAKRPAGYIISAGVLNPALDGRTDIASVPLEPRSKETLAALRSLVPRAKRVVAFYPATSPAAVAEAMASAATSGMVVDFRLLKQLNDFQDVFRSALVGTDAVWILPDVRLGKPEIVKFMVSSCLERKLPLVGFMDGMTRAGALMSASADFVAIGREAGKLATELGGKAPGRELPAHFVPGRISVNQRTHQLLAPEGKPPAGAEVIP